MRYALQSRPLPAHPWKRRPVPLGRHSTSLEYCTWPCDAYSLSNLDMAASLALYNNNIDPRNTPIACEDLERKALTWTCFTAEMFGVSLSDDVWKLLSFGGVTAGSEPLVFTEVPGQPQVLDKDSFRAYFEQRTGGWECSIAAGSILVVTMALMARRCLYEQLDSTGQAVS